MSGMPKAKFAYEILDILEEQGIELNGEEKVYLHTILREMGIDVLSTYLQEAYYIDKCSELEREKIIDSLLRLIGREYYDERKCKYESEYYD